MSAKLAGKRKRGEFQGVPQRPFKRVRRVPDPYFARAGELKFHDVDVDDAIVSATGTIQNTGTINVIPQGVTEVQRIGRKCTIKSIHWRFSADQVELNNGATPQTSEVIRAILYMDKQTNGVTAAVTDVLETATHRSFRNLANTGRFQIFMDKTMVFNYQTFSYDTAGMAGDSAEVVGEYQFNKKCNIPIEFSGANGTIDEIRSNNLGVLLISKSGQGGFASSLRLRFSDQ